MRNIHSDKYKFQEPTSIEELRERVRDLVISIQSVEKQLGDPRQKERRGAEYDSWREQAKASLIFLSAEKRFLIDWGKAQNIKRSRDTDLAFDLLQDVLDAYYSPQSAEEMQSVVKSIEDYLK